MLALGTLLHARFRLAPLFLVVCNVPFSPKAAVVRMTAVPTPIPTLKIPPPRHRKDSAPTTMATYLNIGSDTSRNGLPSGLLPPLMKPNQVTRVLKLSTLMPTARFRMSSGGGSQAFFSGGRLPNNTFCLQERVESGNMKTIFQFLQL